MTNLSDRFANSVARAFVKLGRAGSLVTGVGTASPTTSAVTLIGPANDVERYTATGADTKVTATFTVKAAGLTVAPRNGDQVTVDSRTWAIIAVTDASVDGVGVVYTLDVGEIGDE